MEVRTQPSSTADEGPSLRGCPSHAWVPPCPALHWSFCLRRHEQSTPGTAGRPQLCLPPSPLVLKEAVKKQRHARSPDKVPEPEGPYGRCPLHGHRLKAGPLLFGHPPCHAQGEEVLGWIKSETEGAPHP